MSVNSDEKHATTQLERPGLYLVSTPIGNLDDITLRALKVLRSADLVLAEDTRHSRVLFDHFGLKTRMEAYHDFNKIKRTPALLDYLEKGHAVALICDAGTPGVADEAFFLVRAAREKGIPVFPIPGASALLAALPASGLPTDHFSFENFPPKKSAQRLRKLEVLKARWSEAETHAPTLVFYVSPYQVRKFVDEIGQVFGPDLRVVLARELTKKFEEIRSATPGEHTEYYREREPRGEYVLLFHPQNKG